MDFTKPLVTDNLKEESMIFKVDCSTCGAAAETRMCTVTIPYFKELIIMSFLCEKCGTHSTETKPGGEMSKNAIKISLHVKSDNDLLRDLYKSETCAIKIPELELEVEPGSLGGMYTTVEGLLDKIHENLSSDHLFIGDSSSQTFKA